ncbi:aspartate--ammonia ligase [[Mycoplasma] testudinis]|uniref:aspartate--ammonia ligase n=1 Tax=[Mycoplasma] testudinis TaxID=33924 RepID=UPI00048331CB|nr:aspartate--ammonia ligase [[Mycoplasma] testudinis]
MKKISLLETQKAIKFIKDFFQNSFSKELVLHRVSAPIIVASGTGINDNLAGWEHSLGFSSKHSGVSAEVIHSLAKWKRWSIERYEIPMHEGIYADMNALRIDETLDEIHSIYVDQWDWELRIQPTERTLDFLKSVVNRIYTIIRKVQLATIKKYGDDKDWQLPKKITFVTTQELLDMYPNLDTKERENAIAKKHGAVFLIGIGHLLSNGKPHDVRSPDYDDWNLNGDILVYNPKTDKALELSSMGIRVDAASMRKQLKLANAEDRKELMFHKMLLSNKLPQTIGGGIGQSRLCYFFLQKQHIGEIQSSVWTDEINAECKKKKITLL